MDINIITIISTIVSVAAGWILHLYSKIKQKDIEIQLWKGCHKNLEQSYKTLEAQYEEVVARVSNR